MRPQTRSPRTAFRLARARSWLAVPTPGVACALRRKAARRASDSRDSGRPASPVVFRGSRSLWLIEIWSSKTDCVVPARLRRGSFYGLSSRYAGYPKSPPRPGTARMRPGLRLLPRQDKSHNSREILRACGSALPCGPSTKRFQRATLPPTCPWGRGASCETPSNRRNVAAEDVLGATHTPILSGSSEDRFGATRRNGSRSRGKDTSFMSNRLFVGNLSFDATVESAAAQRSRSWAK